MEGPAPGRGTSFGGGPSKGGVASPDYPVGYGNPTYTNFTDYRIQRSCDLLNAVGTPPLR
jgi:hypothetical protein